MRSVAVLVLDELAVFEFGVLCEVFGLDCSRVTPVTTASFNQKAARPLVAGLRIDKAKALLATPLRTPEQGLRAMREALEGGR